MIKELRREYPLAVLCRVLGVSRSGYQAWLTRAPSKRACAYERLKSAARAAHHRTRQTYGASRLRRELATDGFAVSLGTVKRVRRALGLRCVQRQQRFRVQTTGSGQQLPVAPNLLEQDFKAGRPDEVWTADITYVATREGRLYVAAIKDLFAGEVVGRACGERMTTDLVGRACGPAVSTRRPAPGLIHHTESRVAVLQPRIPGVVARLRGECLDEPQGELLRQRSYRELPGDAEDGVGASSALPDTRGSRARDQRAHRSVL